MKKTILLVVGRTASGKDSMVKNACKHFNLKQVVSYATRPIRPTETNGVEHYFIDKTDAEKYRNEMVAYTQIGEFEYFATFGELDKSDFYIIDPNGVKYLRQTCGNKYNFKTVYVTAPEDLRIKRAVSRGDKETVVRKRIESENEQFAKFESESLYDYKIENNKDFNSALRVFEMIVCKDILQTKYSDTIAKLTWDLPEEEWLRYQGAYARDDDVKGDYLGCCRIGEVCFDIIPREFDDGELAMSYDVFIGGVDTGYGYSAEDALKTGKYQSKHDVPDDELYPYDEVDSDLFTLCGRKVSFGDIDFDTFKLVANAEFAIYLERINNRVIKEKASMPLHVW